MSGVATLNGKLPIMWTLGGLSFQSHPASGGNVLARLWLSTSPHTMDIRPSLASSSICSGGSKRLSFSTTTNWLTFLERMTRVREPAPGPTSHTWPLVILPAADTSLLVSLGSNRKFWDNCLTAWRRYKFKRSRTPGNEGKRDAMGIDMMITVDF